MGKNRIMWAVDRAAGDADIGRVQADRILVSVVEPTISLERLELLLRRETSCIASEDVAILMATFYGDVRADTPQHLLNEAEANNGA